MKYASGSKCGDTVYTLKIDLTCNSNADDSAAAFKLLSNSSVDPCNVYISANVAAACPVLSLSWLMDQYLFIFTLVFLVAGGFMTFYGLHLFAKVLFVFGALAVGTVILVPWICKHA